MHVFPCSSTKLLLFGFFLRFDIPIRPTNVIQDSAHKRLGATTMKIHLELKIQRAHSYSKRLAQRPLKIHLSTHKQLGATAIEDPLRIEDSACALLQQQIGATAIEDTPKHY